MSAARLAANPPSGVVEGTASDASGARLPGVMVEIVPVTNARASVAKGPTDAQGAFRFENITPGEYWVQLTLGGFSQVREKVQVAASGTATVSATLTLERLAEQVSVTADAIKLDSDRATQAVAFSKEVLTQIPTASRSYTHVIVAEAGVTAPLPDRTGRGMNLATEPGAQAPPLSAMRGAERQAALATLEMRFDVPDAVPTERLNRIVWGHIRGWNQPYPTVKTAVFAPMSIDMDDEEREEAGERKGREH